MVTFANVGWTEGLGEYLESNLFGQTQPVEEFTSYYLRGETSPVRPGRSKGMSLLLGPTGVGKTDIVNLVLKREHGENWKERRIRYNMGDYADPGSVSVLLGGPDGDGTLCRDIDELNKLGGGLIFFDELEKAHDTVLKMLLGLDAGEIVSRFDGRSCRVENLRIIGTTNAGGAKAAAMAELERATIVRTVMEEAKRIFSPEFLARFVAIVFNPLNDIAKQFIAKKFLAGELKARSQYLRRPLYASESAFRLVLSKGFSRELGARGVRDMVERQIGDALLEISLAALNRSGGMRPPTDILSKALVVDAADRVIRVLPFREAKGVPLLELT